MSDDHRVTPRRARAATRRRDQVIVGGFTADGTLVDARRTDPDPKVRVAALGAAARLGTLTTEVLVSALEDPAPVVRRRALELAATARGRGTRSTLLTAVLARLGDEDPLVVDAACWTLGERRARDAVGPLCALSANHDDSRCREAAVAALGAIGDPAGLDAILDRLGDKPQVRRRVVVALAAFDGPGVDAALEQCRADHDWQVRQAVELLERSS